VKIGILGGIGPEATAEFYSKLIKKIQEKKLIKSNKDYPQIIINSIPAPELIENEISEEDLEHYIKGLKELERFGVDFIVMICNTIYLFYNNLQKEINVPILDLRKGVRNFLINNNFKNVLIIGTPNTIKKGLYRFEGINCIEPNDNEMRFLSRAIFDFNKGLGKEKQIQIVKKICKSKKVDAVLLGCTELAVMLDKSDISRINTIDILVEATIKKFITFKKQEGLKLV